MEWRDSGYVLSARRHGESHAVLTLLTERHGRHAGWVRGATAKRMRGVLERGNRVSVLWKARLEEHLGLYMVEMEEAHAARLMDNALALLALDCLAALAGALPDRAASPSLFQSFGESLSRLASPMSAAAALVSFENTLLRELGYGVPPETAAARIIHDGSREDDMRKSLAALDALGSRLLADVYAPYGRTLPPARLRLVEKFRSADSSRL